ncbi:MAG: VWA domain-containing protein, partial [bacterium]|nr:VWA domain-containing protein [bacterium]
MIFTTPSALLLLLIILPVVGYLGFPRNRFRRVRDISSLALRVILFALLIMALAGAQLVQSANRSAVVFLVDASDSLGGVGQSQAEAYIRQSLQSMRLDDLAGIIVFGADAQVVRTMSDSRELAPIRSQPNGGNTDLEAAIRLGLALLPQDAVRRMVILSDGLPTTGDALNAAQLAQSADVEISYMPYERPQGTDIQISSVDVPPNLNEDQEFDLIVTLDSTISATVNMTVLSSEDIIYQQPVTVREGTNSYTIRLLSGTSGFRDFKVRIDNTDGVYQNNTLSAFTRVEGIPRVLVVVGENGDEDTRYIIPALQENGLEVTTISSEAFPTTSAGLAEYESVILVNVPATRLSNQRMENLRAYISDLGGGLVVIGGDNAYGLGGYYRTPLEEMLPVEMQIKDQERLPQLTIAYMIDRSGSMGALTPEGIPYIELAKEAIIRSLEFLQPTDRAAVGSFDTDAYWIAEFQDVEDRVQLQRLVGTLRSSGGTSILAGMRLVAETIVNEPAEIKHIILLTDGGADSAGLIPLTAELYTQHNITVSVISIGDAESSFLPQMAEAGHGNYHAIPDASSVPSIFTLETVLATRSYIQEQPFIPIITDHPILQGLEALPQLYGYVATTPRPAAQIVMRGFEPYSDPILATWQYGLGRTVAFMSDATARWGADWVSWSNFSRFWGQTVRWTISEGRSENLETRVIYEDGSARILVDARDNDGRFLNGLALQSNVVYSESP